MKAQTYDVNQKSRFCDTYTDSFRYSYVYGFKKAKSRLQQSLWIS